MKNALCPMCKEQKRLVLFYKDKYKKNGHTSRCKVCIDQKKKVFKKKNPEKVKLWMYNFLSKNPDYKKNLELIYRYKISLNEFNLFLQRQNNKCSICRLNFSKKNKPCVDHSHDTKKIRGLLCSKCNILLGLCNDSIEVLQEAISYLNSEKEKLIEVKTVYETK